MEHFDPRVSTAMAGCPGSAACEASRVLADGRRALHQLAQAVAAVVGTVELLGLQPSGAPGRAALERDLDAALGLLIERTERLRDVLAATDLSASR
jgi:hypothetical protein